MLSSSNFHLRSSEYFFYSLFRDMPPDYDPQCKETWESEIRSERYCNALNSSLFHTCLSYVDPSYYHKACKLDMCECPGDTCHCEVLTAYARECEQAGVIVRDWREATGCENMTSFRFTNAAKEAYSINDSSNSSSPEPTGSGEEEEDRRRSPQPRLPYATLNGGIPGRDDEAESEEDRLGEVLPGNNFLWVADKFLKNCLSIYLAVYYRCRPYRYILKRGR